MKIVFLDAWVCYTMMTRFEKREKRGGHRQNVNADMFTSYVNKAVGQRTGQTSPFVEIWEPEELELPSKNAQSNLGEDETRRALRHSRRDMRVV